MLRLHLLLFNVSKSREDNRNMKPYLNRDLKRPGLKIGEVLSIIYIVKTNTPEILILKIFSIELFPS